MSHPVTGQTLDQAEDGAIEDVRDHTAVVRLFLPLGTEQQLSWNDHSRRDDETIINSNTISLRGQSKIQNSKPQDKELPF